MPRGRKHRPQAEPWPGELAREPLLVGAAVGLLVVLVHTDFKIFMLTPHRSAVTPKVTDFKMLTPTPGPTVTAEHTCDSSVHRKRMLKRSLRHRVRRNWVH